MRSPTGRIDARAPEIERLTELYLPGAASGPPPRCRPELDAVLTATRRGVAVVEAPSPAVRRVLDLVEIDGLVEIRTAE